MLQVQPLPSSATPSTCNPQETSSFQTVIHKADRLIRGGLLLNVRHEACGPPHIRPLLGWSHRRGVRQVLQQEGGSSDKHEKEQRLLAMGCRGTESPGASRHCSRECTTAKRGSSGGSGARLPHAEAGRHIGPLPSHLEPALAVVHAAQLGVLAIHPDCTRGRWVRNRATVAT